MNDRGVRPYCKRPASCVAGTRGKCRLCHGTPSQRNDAIVAYHNKGARTLREVAVRFGLSYQRIQMILRDVGVTARKQHHRSLRDLSSGQRRRFHTLCNKGFSAADAHVAVRRDHAHEAAQ